jgi:hypothetical protein
MLVLIEFEELGLHKLHGSLVGSEYIFLERAWAAIINQSHQHSKHIRAGATETGW